MAVVCALFVSSGSPGIAFSRVLRLTGDVKCISLCYALRKRRLYGLPVVEQVIGKGCFYSAVFNIWFNILTWTVGIRIMSGKTELSGKKPS